MPGMPKRGMACKREHMNSQDFECVLRLPFFHGETAEPWLKRFAPTNEDNAAYAPHLPLAPDVCRKILAELRGLSLGDVQTMSLTMSPNRIGEEISFKNESSALSAFAASGAYTRTPLQVEEFLRQAHIILLWAWRLEELAWEIADMEAECGRREQCLVENFQESFTPLPKREMALDPALLPPWRIVAANALLLCPEALPVFCEGAMAEDMTDLLEFEPVVINGTPGFLGATSPLWKVIGQTRPAAQRLPEELAWRFDVDRLWLLEDTRD